MYVTRRVGHRTLTSFVVLKHVKEKAQTEAAVTKDRFVRAQPDKESWRLRFQLLVGAIIFIRWAMRPCNPGFTLYKQIHCYVSKMTSSLLDCVAPSLAGYEWYQIFNHWMFMLLYHPVEFIVAVSMNTANWLLNLPPFFIRIVLPLTGCYIIHRLIRCALDEYQTFLDLGRGGTPNTPLGLIRVSIEKFLASVDVLDPPHIDPMLEPYRGLLFGLKKRRGERPIVKGVAPQRQFNQKTPVQTFDQLMQMLRDAAEKDKTLLKVTTSYLEGHTDCLKAIFPHRPHKVWGTDGEWDFEIAHPHRNDGSLHVILHPEDVRTVIESGWGERHPLATDATWWRLFHHYIRHRRRPVPYNLVLVYAPRTAAEFKVIQQIVDAAIWYHREKDIFDRIRQGLVVRTECGAVVSREQGCC